MLDSLGKSHHVCYQQICNYLEAEAIRRLNIDPKDFKPPVHVKGRAPQQPNYTDCGVYCLYCIKGLYENPDRIRSLLVSPQSNNDKHWVSALVTSFRSELLRIFNNKIEEYDAYRKEHA
jgi:Ulp1 family protease